MLKQSSEVTSSGRSIKVYGRVEGEGSHDSAGALPATTLALVFGIS